MKKTTLILDLDGVLITTAPWKVDEVDSDGYSKFNDDCVLHLNTLLSIIEFRIVLSSTRRITKSLKEFNQLFEHRGIEQKIDDFIPIYKDCKTRKDEIEKFVMEKSLKNYLIIDDDKSLNDLKDTMKKNLVLTELLKGFDSERLKEAKIKIKDYKGP